MVAAGARQQHPWGPRYPEALGRLDDLPTEPSRYACEILPAEPAPYPRPARRHCLLRDTLPSGAAVTLEMTLDGSLTFLLESWPETPDSASHSRRLTAVLGPLQRRLGPPTICGASSRPWNRGHFWQTEQWLAELRTTRNVQTEWPSEIQFQARLKAPGELISCMVPGD